MASGLHVSGPSFPPVHGEESPLNMVRSVPGVRVRTSTAASSEKSMGIGLPSPHPVAECASELAARHLPVNGRDVAASAADAEPRLQPRPLFSDSYNFIRFTNSPNRGSSLTASSIGSTLR